MRLLHKINIRTVSLTDDGYGTFDKGTPVTKYNNLACWVQPTSNRERMLQDRESVVSAYLIFMEPKYNGNVVNIDQGDEIVCQSKPYKNFVFEVDSVIDAAGMGHHLEISVSRVS